MFRRVSTAVACKLSPSVKIGPFLEQMSEVANTGKVNEDNFLKLMALTFKYLPWLRQPDTIPNKKNVVEPKSWTQRKPTGEGILCTRGGNPSMTAHRSFTPEFKAQVVLEVLTGVRSVSALPTEAGSRLSM